MTTTSTATEPSDHGLWPALEQLRAGKFTDLTHAFEPGIPHASDMPNENRRTLYDFDDDGFQAHLYEFPGQWGTHVDPPVHYCRGGRTIDAIHVTEMLLPLVIIDVRDPVAANADFTVSVAEIQDWERRNGRIPKGSFAALRSGWSARWPDSDAMQNKDPNGVSHWPGWSVEALAFLVDERGITACGHETTDTDPGVLVSRDEFPAETLILERDRYQIEMLSDMAGLPESGAVVVCAFPKPRGGSGFPARIFAIAP